MQPIRPTETTEWSRCPQLWYYRHVEGLRRPGIPFTPEIWMGTAIHAGMAAFWLQEPHRAIQAAMESLSAAWPLDGEYSIDGMADLLERVMGKLIIWCGALNPDIDVVAVETPLGEDGHTTPDLVYRRRSDGGLGIIDWKYHHEVKAEHLHYRLEGIERTHQFLHYSWAIGEKYQEPVKELRKVAIVGLPKIIVQDAAFTPDPAALKEWHRQAQIKWHTMKKMREAGDIHGGLVYRREEGCQPYGEKYPCEFWRACWELHGNREHMAQFYVKGELV